MQEPIIVSCEEADGTTACRITVEYSENNENLIKALLELAYLSTTGKDHILIPSELFYSMDTAYKG